MCFETGDCDWTADVEEIHDWPFGLPCVCEECGNPIGYGDYRRDAYQQESEECRECEYEEACVKCDYGATFRCTICESCVKILRAIEAEEADAGCPWFARQPLFGELRDAMFYDGERYAKRALAMYPELSGAKLLELANA